MFLAVLVPGCSNCLTQTYNSFRRLEWNTMKINILHFPCRPLERGISHDFFQKPDISLYNLRITFMLLPMILVSTRQTPCVQWNIYFKQAIVLGFYCFIHNVYILKIYTYSGQMLYIFLFYNIAIEPLSLSHINTVLWTVLNFRKYITLFSILNFKTSWSHAYMQFICERMHSCLYNFV